MYWIDKNDKAHYVESLKEISNNDYNNHLSFIIEENNITDKCGCGNKQFIVRGIGKYSPAIQELVSANSMSECVAYIYEKYKERITIGILLCVQYYEVIK